MGVMHSECFTLETGKAPSGRPWLAQYGSRCTFAGCSVNGGFIAVGARIADTRRQNVAMGRISRQARTSRGTVNLDSHNYTQAEVSRGVEAIESEQETEEFAASIAPSNSDAAGNIVVQALAAMLLPQIKAQIDSKLDAISPETLLENASNTLNAALESKATTYDKLIMDLLLKAEERVNQLSAPQHIEVRNVDTGSNVNLNVQHKQFPLLMKVVQSGVPVWLAGPSGSGKTTAAEMVAKALDMKFYYTGAVGDAYALMGYKDVNGNLVRTAFRDAYEYGGVFLWDEVDASDPNALLAFNSALANGNAAFPDGIIKRHKDCILIAAANTFGHGATHEYVGRLKLDTAFLKRFAFVSWEYDNDLEMNTCGNVEWCKRVQEVRRKVQDRKLRVLVTPRESYLGARLLAQGIAQEEVEVMTIRSGMTEEQWSQLSY